MILQKYGVMLKLFSDGVLEDLSQKRIIKI